MKGVGILYEGSKWRLMDVGFVGLLRKTPHRLGYYEAKHLATMRILS